MAVLDSFRACAVRTDAPRLNGVAAGVRRSVPPWHLASIASGSSGSHSAPSQVSSSVFHRNRDASSTGGLVQCCWRHGELPAAGHRRASAMLNCCSTIDTAGVCFCFDHEFSSRHKRVALSTQVNKVRLNVICLVALIRVIQ